MTSIGSIIQPWVRCSDTAIVANPRSSMRRTASRHAGCPRVKGGIEAMKRNGGGTNPGLALYVLMCATLPGALVLVRRRLGVRVEAPQSDRPRSAQHASGE